MPPRYRFSEGRIHPTVVVDGPLVALAAVATALLRVAFTAAIDLDPNSVFWRGLGGLVRGVAPILPVFILLWQFRVLDKGYSLIASIVASAFGYAGYWMVSRAAELGGPLAVLGELPVSLLLGGVLQFLSAWLLLRALVVWRSASWESRVWATRSLAWPTLLLSDVGIGVVAASGLAWVYASTFWLVYDIGFAAAGLALLLASSVVDKVATRPPGTWIAVDPELPPGEQRLAVCRQLGVEPCSTGPADDLLVGRALWHRDSLTMAHVDTAEGPRWLVVGLDALWDRRIWVLSPEHFGVVRPDLTAFLDLPPGWVVTTSPGEVRFDPNTCYRVASVVQKGTVCSPSAEFLDRLVSVVVDRRSDEAEDAVNAASGSHT